MAERERPQPDEFVIGADQPLYPEEDEGDLIIGAAPAAVSPEPYAPQAPPPQDQWYDGGQADYYPEPLAGEPRRRHESPLYDVEDGTQTSALFLIGGLVVLVGVIGVFLALYLFGGGGDDDDEPVPTLNPGTSAQVIVDEPAANASVNVGEPFDVVVRAIVDDESAEVQLFIDDVRVDEEEVDVTPGTQFGVTLTAVVGERGDHILHVRIVTAGGSEVTSDRIAIIARESIDETPGVITGEVIADTTARAAPNESAAAVGSLRPGEEVVILGQTRAQDWLLINASLGDGIWVRRAAVQAHDSLEFVPIADPTPVPDTPTPTVDESPTETPTPDADLPDLAPAGVEASGTVLRVTISNGGGTGYSGGLVVSVAGVDAGTLSQAFSVDIPAGGSTVVEFALSGPITEERQAEVSVDPDNAVPESAEDNNAGVFVVAPSVETASLAIVNVVLQPGTVAVAVFNDGGDLPLSTVTVTVSVGGQATQLSLDIAIAAGATEFFEVQAPSGSGVATITVLVDGAAVATAQVTIPSDEPEPTETETAEPTETATEEQ